MTTAKALQTSTTVRVMLIVRLRAQLVCLTTASTILLAWEHFQVMASVNKQLNLPEMARNMESFARESEKMNMASEMSTHYATFACISRLLLAYTAC